MAQLKRQLERERHKNSQLTSQLKRQTLLQGRLVIDDAASPRGDSSQTAVAYSLVRAFALCAFTFFQQLQAEQEEEYITNKLMKRLEDLKQEKEELARQVEVEEEMITNALTKKLQKVKEEKVHLENQLEQEQEYIVNRLQKQLSAVLQEKAALETRLRENTSSILHSIQQHLARWKIDDHGAAASREPAAGAIAVTVDHAGAAPVGGGGTGAAARMDGAPVGAAAAALPLGSSSVLETTSSDVASPDIASQHQLHPPGERAALGGAGAYAVATSANSDEWQRTHLLVSHLTCEIDQLGAQQERYRCECETQRISNEKLRVELQKLQAENAGLTRRVAREREVRAEAILERARLETEIELDSERAFNNSSSRSSVTSSPALSSQRGEALFPGSWALPSPRGLTPSLLAPSVVSSVSGNSRAPSPKVGGSGGTPSRDSSVAYGGGGGHASPKLPGTPVSPKPRTPSSSSAAAPAAERMPSDLS